MHRYPHRAVAVSGPQRFAVAAACIVAGCGGRADEVSPDTASRSGTDPATSTAPAELAVQPGRAIVVAGDERFDLIVFECLVGDETGSPARRLALSASATEPFLDANVVLNVDVLVSQQAPMLEEHRITITRRDGTPDLAANDTPRPGEGGPAPDDWIRVDESAGLVRGTGFQLAATDGSAPPLPPGTLVADCSDA